MLHGTVIYVGKAKNLKKRVTSYFQKTDQDPKTRNLISRIESVSVMVTNTETEALLLENNLIKKHQPKYNIDLKDAKRFAYIELTREPFPRIGIARRMSAGDATYFGPFVSASERDALLRVIKRIFCLRSCKKLPKRACLRYHMKSCSAPCIGLISEEDYHQQVERASALLKGKEQRTASHCCEWRWQHARLHRITKERLSSATRSRQSGILPSASMLSARRRLTRMSLRIP